MNQFRRMWNRAIRARRRVTPARLKELRQECEDKWINEPQVLGVGQSEEGIKVYQDSRFLGEWRNVFNDKLDEYTASPLDIVYTEPLSMESWGDELEFYVVPPPESGEYGSIAFDIGDYVLNAVVPTRRIRPIYGGLSVGNYRVTAGTITMIVQDKTTKEPLILSNNHILANLNNCKKGDAILQPGKAFGGTVANDTVGYLERWVTMQNGATADCAVAKLVSPDIGRYGILGLGDVWFLTEPVAGMVLEKSGQTTGFSTGKVTAINGTFKIGAGSQQFTVKEVFVSDIKSAGGDSGSALNERYTAKCAGLLFAGNGSYTLGVTANNVFNQLNIELMDCPYNVVLDLSHYNGHLSTAMMRYAKSRGVKGMIFKMSEGDDYKDSEFDNNATCAEEAGMPWAFYHYNRPAKSAQAQFNWIIRCLGTKVPSFQPMLDNEDTDGCNPDKVTSVSLALLVKLYTHFRPLGYKPPIYYSRGSWHNPNTLRDDDWKQFPLDAARYYVDQVKYSDTDQYFPLDWKNAVLWQCKADRDYLAEYFFGAPAPCKHIDVNYILDQAEFDSWLVHVPPDPGEPEPPDEPEPPEDPTLKTGIHYYGNCVSGVNIRNKPSTVTGSVIGSINKGTKDVEILEEVKENNNTWARLGRSQYCAIYHEGKRYLEYVTV